jgi:hypothetical protein
MAMMARKSTPRKDANVELFQVGLKTPAHHHATKILQETIIF